MTLMKDSKVTLIEVRHGTEESFKYECGFVILVYRYTSSIEGTFFFEIQLVE